MKVKVSLSKYNNIEYSPGAGFIKLICWYFVKSFVFKSFWLPINSFKILILKWFGARVGKGVTIKPFVNIKYPWFLNIGDNVWIGEDVWIDNLQQTDIGNNVCLSQGAMLLTGNHNYSKSTFDLIVKGIVLEDGVWIGAKAVVCPGVICRTHSVLSVQSVATHEMEAYGIYQGNPAVRIRTREMTE